MSVAIKIQLPGGKYRKGKCYKRSLPESFAAIDRERLFLVLRLLLTAPEVPAKIQILKLLLQLPKKVFWNIDEFQMYDLIKALDWMRLEPSPKPIFDRFIHQGVGYWLPKEKFSNGTALEYAIADAFYMAYLDTGKIEPLRHLTATLCRPAMQDKQLAIERGDVRDILKSRNQAIERAKHFEKLDIEKLIGVLLYFSGVKKYVFDTYGNWLFETQNDEDSAEEAPPSQPDFGWWGVFFDVAETGTFGDIKQVHQTNFHTICMYLVNKRIQDKKREEKYKNT